MKRSVFSIFILISILSACHESRVSLLKSDLENYDVSMDSLKRRFLNKYFYVKSVANRKGGSGTVLDPGLRVKCIDLIIDSTTYSYYKQTPMKSLILVNDNGKTVILDVQSAVNWLYTAGENKYYEAIYKSVKWKNIMQGKINLGWDSTVCLLALGQPALRFSKMKNEGGFKDMKSRYKFGFDEVWECSYSQYTTLFFKKGKVIAYEWYEKGRRDIIK